MGLAVVHGIVRDCRGDIEITSSSGQGTRIDVYFPTYAGDARPEAGDALVLKGVGERILVVDDEVALAELTASLLQDLGYRADYFSSSVEALRHFNTCSQEYDLVITDQSMPEMSGIELAQKMLALRPRLPLILCTGYSDVLNEVNVKQCGLGKLLLKPVTEEKLSMTVRELLSA